MSRHSPVDDLVAEKDFARWIRDAARLFRWRYAHFRPAQNMRKVWMTPMEGDPGFPDYVLIRPPRIIFAELKRGGWVPSDVPEPEREWLAALRAVPGIESYVWGPEMRDEIMLVLGMETADAAIERMRELGRPPAPGEGRRPR